MRFQILTLVMLVLCAAAFSESQVSFSVVVVGANTTLTQSVIPGILTGPGNAAFTCNYRYSEGSVFNGKCIILVDGKKYDAFPPSFSRSIALSSGSHSWHCECAADGFQPQIGSPLSLQVGYEPVVPADTQVALQVIAQANNSIAEAQRQGLETGDAESFIRLASLALAQNDTTRANAFALTAKRLASSAPPKSAVTFLNSLGWVAPLAGFAAVVISLASFQFFRTYFKKKEGGL